MKSVENLERLRISCHDWRDGCQCKPRTHWLLARAKPARHGCYLAKNNQDRNMVSVDPSMFRDPPQATEIRGVRAREVNVTAPNESPPPSPED
jgi:hypothetical protein